jgi:hypothetical protein
LLLTGQRVASNGLYRSSLSVCYHLQARYYGMTPATEAEAVSELNEDQVDYLLYWDDPAQTPSYLQDAVVTLNVSEQQLRVYQLH